MTYFVTYKSLKNELTYKNNYDIFLDHFAQQQVGQKIVMFLMTKLLKFVPNSTKINH